MTIPTDSPIGMDRREAIRRVSIMLGGALVGGNALITACSRDRSSATNQPIGAFTPTDIAYLDEIADTILPDTAKSPGAKAAGVGAFLALMVTDCYEASDQAIFRAGMTTLNDACVAAHGVGFMSATPAQRLALLEGVDRDAKTYREAKTPDQPNHYFRMVKELTMVGYFTSEIGYTKAMRYVESPGRFDPCVPYTKGETSWARHA
jgi:hypothetical protein